MKFSRRYIASYVMWYILVSPSFCEDIQSTVLGDIIRNVTATPPNECLPFWGQGGDEAIDKNHTHMYVRWGFELSLIKCTTKSESLRDVHRFYICTFMKLKWKQICLQRETSRISNLSLKYSNTKWESSQFIQGRPNP